MSTTIHKTIDKYLLEYHFLLEKIRSKTFDMNLFRRLPPEEQAYYAKKSNLKVLGRGSSRIAFLLSSNKVLKIAYDMIKAGRAQNKQEVDLGTDPNFIELNVAAKIFDYDSQNFNWLITEPVRLFRNKKEFYEAVNLDFFKFEMLIKLTLKAEFRDYQEAIDSGISHLKNKIKIAERDIQEREAQSTESLKDRGIEFRTRKLIKDLKSDVTDQRKQIIRLLDLSENKKAENIYYAIIYGNLIRGDARRDWGKTVDGRVVMIDFGANYDLMNKYY